MIESLKFARAIWAGFLATVVMTVLMYGWPLLGHPSMDIMAALGAVFPFDISPYVMGSVIHLGIGISLAFLYALVFDPWLPGPGWLRGSLFSFIPWLFAITLLGPTLLTASEFLKGKEAAPANPCSVSNPCTVRQANPCSVKQAKSNPCSPQTINPCGVIANPCAVANPCGSGSASPSGPSPQAMSLMVHLLYGAVLGAAYRPSGT